MARFASEKSYARLTVVPSRAAFPRFPPEVSGACLLASGVCVSFCGRFASRAGHWETCVLEPRKVPSMIPDHGLRAVVNLLESFQDQVGDAAYETATSRTLPLFSVCGLPSSTAPLRCPTRCPACPLTFALAFCPPSTGSPAPGAPLQTPDTSSYPKLSSVPSRVCFGQPGPSLSLSHVPRIFQHFLGIRAWTGSLALRLR